MDVVIYFVPVQSCIQGNQIGPVLLMEVLQNITPGSRHDLCPVRLVGLGAFLSELEDGLHGGCFGGSVDLAHRLDPLPVTAGNVPLISGIQALAV